ncbi:MAG: NnrS family protein [Pigmentiphaga sp.]
MAEFLSIQEPRPARPARPEWAAFLELGFRPLYAAGCFWAAVSVALWVFWPGLLRAQLGGVVWHAHEMLWGFIATIAVGFLLTAGNNWTGINPLKGRALGALCLLWVVARIAFLMPGAIPFWLGVLCELLFFAGAAWALGRAIYGARSRRNYGVPLLVLGLGASDALFLVTAWGGDYALLMWYFDVGLMCMALIALLVARRVIPFFAMRAVSGLAIPMHLRTGQWQLGLGGLGVILGLFGWMPAAAIALAAAGVITLVQVVSWKPGAVMRVPLLWILYIGYAALGIGLLLAAAYLAGWLLRAAWPVHVIGMAGFSVLIIGMVTRTALGHLGRPLRTDGLIVTCYVLMIAAVALRLLALLPTGLALAALQASAACWALSFALYLWRFFPMLIRPRADLAMSRPVSGKGLPRSGA